MEYARLLERFGKLPALQGATWGLAIRDPKSGAALVKAQSTTNLIPASNMKLVTSLNGLWKLGPDYQFTTRVYADGPLEGEVLKGNVLVEGSGDPTMYSPDREKFDRNFFLLVKEAFLKAGIRRIEGKILTLPGSNPYEGIRNDWGWADVGNYYGAGIYPLNINENQYHLFFDADQSGKAARLKKTDSLADVGVDETRVDTEGPDAYDLAYIYWVPGARKVRVSGSLPSKPDLQKVKGALQDPAQVFREVLKSQLAQAGIQVEGKVLAGGGDKRMVYEHKGAPLARIVKEVNLFSNNLMTESLAYALAGPSAKADENGWTQLEAFAKAVQCPPGYYLADGSGLSPTNRISPDGLCRALIWARKQPFFGVFRESLPVAGESGTMKKFCLGAKGKIRAKSGTLNRTLCYSGYADAPAGELVFSIMLNNYHGPFKTMKAELEKVMEGLTTIR